MAGLRCDHGQVGGRRFSRAFADIRAPSETLAWIDDVCRWPFERVVTSHFASPFAAPPSEVRGWAFGMNPRKSMRGTGSSSTTSRSSSMI